MADSDLYRVLTHPAIGVRNWGLDAAVAFSKIYSEILNIQRRITIHRLTRIVKGRYGVHYKECPWADPNVTMGPDTCVCCYISMNRVEIARLLNTLGRLATPKKHRRSRSAHL